MPTYWIKDEIERTNRPKFGTEKPSKKAKKAKPEPEKIELDENIIENPTGDEQ